MARKVEHKGFRLSVKSLDAAGMFEGYLSTWDKDQGGDLIVPGAFKRTLEAWRSKGRPVPMLWDHDPSHPIGAFVELEEDEKGLRVKGQLALAVGKAAEVYELLKLGVVNGLSIGYSVVVQEWTDQVRLLKELRLWEGSLVLWPMNEAAEVDSVKDLRRLLEDPGSMALDPARRAQLAENLKNVVALLEPAPQPPAPGAGEGKGEDPGTRQESPAGPGPQAYPDADLKALLEAFQRTEQTAKRATP